jgi:hypothetical protein
MDADDNDPTVNTVASWRTKYGSGPNDSSIKTLRAYLTAVKGYNPSNLWFIDPVNGNDGNCVANDISHPCQGWYSTWQKTNSAGGDAMIARGGTWTDNSNVYYCGHTNTTVTAANPDICMNYPGETAILDKTVDGRDGFGGGWGGANYTIVDGLQIQHSACSAYPNTCNAPGVGLNFNAPSGGDGVMRGVIVRNCLIRWFFREVWMVNLQDGTLLENNILRDSRGEHNIYFSCIASCMAGSGMTNVIVRNNILATASWDSFHSNGKMTNLLLESNIAYSSNTSDSSGPPALQFQNGTNHSRIQNNVVLYNSSHPLSFDTYNGDLVNNYPVGQNYNTVANNTLIFSGYSYYGNNLTGNAYPAIQIDNNASQFLGLDNGHNTFINNVLVTYSKHPYSNIVNYSQWNSSDLPWWTTDTWKNNIMYQTTLGSPLAIGQTNVDACCDASWMRTWAQFGTLAGTFTNNLNTNPNFTAYDPQWYATPERYNVALVSGSPALGAGFSAGAPASDIAGRARSNPPSMGAYETAGGAGAPPSSPCDLNGDGLVNSTDVNLAINQVLGLSTCTMGSALGTTTCTAVDVQRVINAALGGSCLVGK